MFDPWAQVILKPQYLNEAFDFPPLGTEVISIHCDQTAQEQDSHLPGKQGQAAQPEVTLTRYRVRFISSSFKADCPPPPLAGKP